MQNSPIAPPKSKFQSVQIGGIDVFMQRNTPVRAVSRIFTFGQVKNAVERMAMRNVDEPDSWVVTESKAAR